MLNFQHQLCTSSSNLNQYLFKNIWCQSKAKRPCSLSVLSLSTCIHLQSGCVYLYSHEIRPYSIVFTCNHLQSFVSFAITCILCGSLSHQSGRSDKAYVMFIADKNRMIIPCGSFLQISSTIFKKYSMLQVLPFTMKSVTYWLYNVYYCRKIVLAQM